MTTMYAGVWDWFVHPDTKHPLKKDMGIGCSVQAWILSGRAHLKRTKKADRRGGGEPVCAPSQEIENWRKRDNIEKKWWWEHARGKDWRWIPNWLEGVTKYTNKVLISCYGHLKSSVMCVSLLQMKQAKSHRSMQHNYVYTKI